MPSTLPVRVLLVEDDPDNRDILSTRLRAHGWEVDEASDGAEALALVDRGGYSLVVLDFWLPKFNGAEVLAYLHAVGAAPPAIMMSAVPQGLALPGTCRADVYLRKPFASAELIASGERLIARAARPEATPTGRSGTYASSKPPAQRKAGND